MYWKYDASPAKRSTDEKTEVFNWKMEYLTETCYWMTDCQRKQQKMAKEKLDVDSTALAKRMKNYTKQIGL